MNSNIQKTSFWKSKTPWYFGVGFVVGIVIFSIVSNILINKLKHGSINVSISNDGVSFENPKVDFVEALNQKAGKQVTVSAARVHVASWIAVRENNGDVMGRILGAQQIEAGEHEGVVIDLLRETTPNVMYAVVIYKDNGKGEFDYDPTMLLEQDGKIILSRFVAEN